MAFTQVHSPIDQLQEVVMKYGEFQRELNATYSLRQLNPVKITIMRRYLRIMQLNTSVESVANFTQTKQLGTALSAAYTILIDKIHALESTAKHRGQTQITFSPRFFEKLERISLGRLCLRDMI